MSDEERLAAAKAGLSSPKTAVRIDTLADVLLWAQDEALTLAQAQDLIKLLIPTIPKYVDHRSRQSVLSVLVALLKNAAVAEPVASLVAKWLDVETSKKSANAAVKFVHLTWITAVFDVVSLEKHELWSSIVAAWAKVHAFLADDSSNHLKASLKNSALVVTRRHIRNNHSEIPALVTHLAAAKVEPAYLYAPLLSTSLDVIFHLKNVKGIPNPSEHYFTAELRAKVSEYYCTQVLSCRVLPPPVVLEGSFQAFLALLTPEEVDTIFFPACTKALARTPEISYRIVQSFFAALQDTPEKYATETVRSKLLPSFNSSSKSANVGTRQVCVSLFKTVFGNPRLEGNDEFLLPVVEDLSTLLKTGKTASADHRTTLLIMLASLPVSQAVADALVPTAFTVLQKEGNESALAASTSLLSRFLPEYLKTSAVSDTGVQALIKILKDTKPLFRRHVMSMLGAVFWSYDSDDVSGFTGVIPLAKALIPAFEASLKSYSANALNSAGGPLELYVVIAVSLLRLSKWHVAEATSFVAKNAVMQSLPHTGAKPSLLLWDKVYRKATSEDDQLWLLRAFEGLFSHKSEQFEADSALRVAFGMGIIHLTTHSSRVVAALVEQFTASQCGNSVVQTFLSEAFVSWSSSVSEGTDRDPLATSKATPSPNTNTPQLAKEDATAKVSVDDAESDHKDRDHSLKLRRLLMALSTFDDSVPESTRGEFVSALIVFAHHPRLHTSTKNLSGLWIDMLMGARVAPDALVETRLGALFDLIVRYTGSADAYLVQAAYAALSTIVRILPGGVAPLVLQQITEDLSAERIAFIGDTEIGVWNTPEGTCFVDVLSTTEKAAPVRKSKEKDIELWEAEVRKSLKQKQSGTLSKQEQALVQRQLETEADIRGRVAAALASFQRGFGLIDSLVAAGVPDVTETAMHAIVSRLLEVLVLPPITLVSSRAFETYIGLSRVCEARVGAAGQMIGIATLRGLNAPVVPAAYAQEPLSDLVLRVLHQLRFVSEQTPLSGGAFAYAAPLAGLVLAKGGVGVAGESEEAAEAALEQCSLALDLIAFHASNAALPAFPRQAMIDDLIVCLRAHPTLSRRATDALLAVSEAIEAVAGDGEIRSLLAGTLSDEAYVRFACLQGLAALDLLDLHFSPELWVAVHDVDARNRGLAEECWAENGLEVDASTFVSALVPFLFHDGSAAVRHAAADALAAAVGQHPASMHELFSRLYTEYVDKARERVAQYDQFGILIDDGRDANEDPWEQGRVAIAWCFQATARYFDADIVSKFFDLLIEREALNDRSDSVRGEILDAAIAVVDVHGKENLPMLIETFEGYLSREGGAKPGKNGGEGGADADASRERGETLGKKTTSKTKKVAAPKAEATPAPVPSTDHVTEALIILLGRLAHHLDANDARVASIAQRLIDALPTPSEAVQAAVCDCLAGLARQISADVPKMVETLLDQLFSAESYAARRGAAYGLAGLVKGRGLYSLREFSILPRLRDGAADRDSASTREGALFAFEILPLTLGRLFEPYAADTVPVLLAGYGDASPDVRAATADAAAALMRGLSGHAVTELLPTLLAGLDERQWRAKKGAVELLGAMAALAPHRLAQFLPQVLPALTEALTDTHRQVRDAGNASLRRFGDAVACPEVRAMQGALLAALVDPAKKTRAALDTLLRATFAHVVDASALALVVPVLERGLRARSADTKRKAAAIVGTLATLAAPGDLAAYVPELVPLLRGVLVDPVPEARSTAAKSLGGLVARLGEDAVPTLLPALRAVLSAPAGGVDQQGAAQGVAEILASLGTARLEAALPGIIAGARAPRTCVREGHVSLLVFLPATFGERFAPYLAKIIPAVLAGLADESDFVRDASLKAGRMIVSSHRTRAIELLLPELERGLFDPSWRIRQSSVQLVGELLFRVVGISGRVGGEDDDDAGSDAGGDGDGERDADADADAPAGNGPMAALTAALTAARRDRILAALYIARQDTTGAVRQASVHVWKALVPNTPRAVRDMLPTLMQLVIGVLGSPSAELRGTAARCLADTCHKLGESVVGDVVAILAAAGTAPDARTREGVSAAVAELLQSASKNQLAGHESAVIAVIRQGLVDGDAAVCAAAARAFDVAQRVLGTRSIDETLPTLLDALATPGDGAAAALRALQEVMQVRAEKIFPVLVPRLIKRPISAFNARAVGALVQVAGSALGRRLTEIVDALESERAAAEPAGSDAAGPTDSDRASALATSLTTVLASVTSPETGLDSLQMHLLGLAKAPAPAQRVTGCVLFARFCAATTADNSDYYLDWIRQLVSLMDDPAPEVVDAAWSALDAFAKSLDKEEMNPLVVTLRRTIEGTGVPGTAVPGFSRPNGLKPILPILLQGLLTGTAEQREQAAYAIGDLVARTAPAAFKAYCIQTVGPLIRVIGDRFPAPVKTAILSTLSVFLENVPQFVKPFFPQLQRTFVKSVLDVLSLSVRKRGAAALGLLMQHQPRIDPLVTELTNLCAVEEGDVLDSVVYALANVVRSGGKNLSEGSKSAIVDVISEAFADKARDSQLTAIAKLVASLAMHDIEAVEGIISTYLISDDLPPTRVSVLTLKALIDDASDEFYAYMQTKPTEEEDGPEYIAGKIAKLSNTSSNPPFISRPAREIKELLKEREVWLYDSKVQAKL